MTKNTKMYYTAKSRSHLSMNGGAAEDRSAAAIKKVSEERRTEKRREKAHMVFRMIFSPQCTSMKVKESVSGQILAQMRASQTLAEFKKKKKSRAKFVPGRQ